MDNKIIVALLAKYNAEIAEAEANVEVYMNNPAGIGEHPDIVAAVDTQISKIANAIDKIGAIRERYL
jgi:hypothetical protein|tara:strand:+ start:2038 stop:2238 length:201 start_codon:yes stop_codon:yes gene_type:complete